MSTYFYSLQWLCEPYAYEDPSPSAEREDFDKLAGLFDTLYALRDEENQ